MEKREMVEAHRDAWIWIYNILLTDSDVGIIR